jgi:hypothetical protein
MAVGAAASSNYGNGSLHQLWRHLLQRSDIGSNTSHTPGSLRFDIFFVLSSSRQREISTYYKRSK